VFGFVIEIELTLFLLKISLNAQRVKFIIFDKYQLVDVISHFASDGLALKPTISFLKSWF
jgi:hypothetical protein